MNCPKCRFPLGLDDRICPRCKYFFEQDRFVSVEPQRRPEVRREEIARAAAASARWGGRGLEVACGLVPGVGHIVAGRTSRGVLFFCIIASLLALSLQTASCIFGQLLLGLAAAAHAYSLFDLIPWNPSAAAWVRVAVMGGLVAILLALYWPLMVFVVTEMYRGQRQLYRLVGTSISLEQLLILALLFVVSAAVTMRWARQQKE